MHVAPDLRGATAGPVHPEAANFTAGASSCPFRTNGPHSSPKGDMLSGTSKTPSVIKLLEQSLASARIKNTRVEWSGDGAALDLVLLGAHRLPFPLDAGQAGAWLTAEGIEAGAGPGDPYGVVIRVPGGDEDMVCKLVDALTADFIQAENVAEALQDALDQHGVDMSAAVNVESLESVSIEICDQDLAAAVTLGRLLGADDIAQDLTPSRRSHMRKLGRRLRWVLQGAVGADVRVEDKPGCDHAPDGLVIRLHPGRIPLLTDRITAAPGSPSACAASPEFAD